MSDNTIDIILSIKPDANAEAVVTRTLASIEKIAAGQGRKIGENLGANISKGLSEKQANADVIFKNALTGVKSFGERMKESLTQQRRDIEQHNAKVNELSKLSTIQQSRDIETYQTKANEINRLGQMQQRRDIEQHNAKINELQRQSQIQQQRDYDQYKAKQAAASITTPSGQMKLAGISSPDEIKAQLAALRESKAVWESAGKGAEGYRGALAKIDAQTNVLTEGNARARGSFHKLAAGLASLTFETTGAIYGLTAIGAIIGGPALFGVKFLKTIEDTKHGIAATITAMTMAAGGTTSYAQSSAIAGKEIDQLSKNAIKYNVSLEDIAKTYQAIIGPGMAAGMTLKEVGQIATIGTMAVKSMGLDSRQVVQEVRDLVQGGIVASSSTLATALGLKDKDINAAKASSEGLFAFLEKRLAGYTLAAMERQNTLSGAWDVLKIKVERLFADESGFSAFKGWLNQISSAIGEIDYKTGEIKFNKDLLKTVEDYWNAIKALGTALATTIEYAVKFLDVALKIGAAFGAMKIAQLVVPGIAAIATAMGVGATVAVNYATSFGIVNSAMLGFETASKRVATTSIATKGGWVGLVLYGLYEIADYSGLIDAVFVTAEQRAQKAFDKIKGMGTKTELQVELVKQQGKLKAMEENKEADFSKRKDSFGIFGALNETNMQREITAQKKLVAATEGNLRKLEDSQEKSNEAQARMQFTASGKALSEYEASRKDAIGIEARYQAELSKIASAYATRVTRKDEKGRLIATSEEAAGALSTYMATTKQAAKERDDAMKALNKPSAEAKKELKTEYDIRKDTFAESLKQEKIRLDEKQIVITGNLADSVYGQLDAEKERYSAQQDSFATQQKLMESEVAWAKAKGNTIYQEKMEADIKTLAEERTKAEITNKYKLLDVTREYNKAVYESNTARQNAISDMDSEIANIGKTAVEIQKLTIEREKQRKIEAMYTKDSENNRVLKPEFIGVSDVIQANEEAIAARKIAYADEQQTFEYGWKDAFGKYADNANNAATQAREAFQTMTKGMEDAMYQFATTGKLSFGSFLKTVLDGMLKIQIAKLSAMAIGGTDGTGGLTGLFGMGLSALMGSTGSGLDTGASYANYPDYGAQTNQMFSDMPNTFNAKGNVFSNSPSLSAFSGGVYNSPQTFAFAKGAGIFAEAGPEAIMPLTRGSNGKLGVQAVGGTGGNTVQVTVHVNSDGTSSSEVSGAEQGKQIGQLVQTAITAALIKEQRNGGLLDRNRRN